MSGSSHTDYDQGAPNNGLNAVGVPYRLATTSTTGAAAPESATWQRTGAIAADLSLLTKTITGYNPIDAAAATDPSSGWTLGSATTTTTVMAANGTPGTGDIVRKTRYDDAGRTVEVRQPKSATGTGTDAGTTLTTYYTADSAAVGTACDTKPQWAGLVCTSGPGDGGSSVLPTTTTTAYSYLLAPEVAVETIGSVTRTTTTTYLADGRASRTGTVASNGTTASAVAGTRTVYDEATGLATITVKQNTATFATGSGTSTDSPAAVGGFSTDSTATGDRVTTGYDQWGRTISYQPGGDASTTTTYVAPGAPGAGQALQVTDPKTTTAYTYDGVDAAGKAEHRGLTTAMTVSGVGTYTAAYDDDGAMTVQTIPGGITQRTSYDEVGEPVALAYNGDVTLVDPITGEPDAAATPDQPWMTWSQTNDLLGRVVGEWTPSGAAYTGGLGAGSGLAYERAYRYDRAGRLTTVEDRTAASTGTSLSPEAGDSLAAACQTRGYAFDGNGNRTTLTTIPANATTGACGTTGGTATTYAYTSADRASTGRGGTGTYVYDAFGRATTVPAVDTPTYPGTVPAGAHDLTLGYFDTDAARSITQDGSTTTFTLDPSGRRATQSSTPGHRVRLHPGAALHRRQ